MNRLLLLGALLAATVVTGQNIAPLFRECFAAPLSREWKPVKIGRLTEYRVERDAETPCLLAVARGSASGLAHAITVAPADRLRLAWHWKIDRVPPNGSDKTLASFDHTARVFIGFKTFLGPPYSIHYVWANTEPVGVTFHHPMTGRARFIVLRSGNAEAGQWLAESRDIVADWRQLFPGKEMPRLEAIGVFTDTDGTGATVTGRYARIELRTE